MREDDLEKQGWWLEVTDSSFPEFERVDGVVPYAIESVECVSMRKMKPKNHNYHCFRISNNKRWNMAWNENISLERKDIMHESIK